MIIRFNKELEKNLPDCYSKSTESNNYKILRLAELQNEKWLSSMSEISEVLDIEKAYGKTLDLYGTRVGQARGNMTDEQYRLMLKAKQLMNFSNGSYKKVMECLCAIFECTQDDIVLEESETETCVVYLKKIPLNIINTHGLTAVQVGNLVKSLLPITVTLVSSLFDGTFEFGASESDYDNEKGFANDNGSIGGYLGDTYGLAGSETTDSGSGEDSGDDSGDSGGDDTGDTTPQYYTVNCTVEYDESTNTMTATPIDSTKTYYVFFKSLTESGEYGSAEVNMEIVDGLCVPNLYMGENLEPSTTYEDDMTLYSSSDVAITSSAGLGEVAVSLSAHGETQISEYDSLSSAGDSTYISASESGNGTWELYTGSTAAYPSGFNNPPFNNMVCCLWVEPYSSSSSAVKVSGFPVSLLVTGDGTGSDSEAEHTHSWSVATCTTPATCSTCGEVSGRVDSTNHTGGTEVINQSDATEFEDGYTGDTRCKGCGVILEYGETIPATHVHSYSVATCTTPATCSCGETTGSVDSTNHVGGTMIRNAIEATTEDEGYTGDTCCLGCGAILIYGETIPKLEPSYYTVNCTCDITVSSDYNNVTLYPIDNTKPYYVFFNSLTQTGYYDESGDVMRFSIAANQLSVPSVYIGTTMTPTLNLDVSTLINQTLSIRGSATADSSTTTMTMYGGNTNLALSTALDESMTQLEAHAYMYSLDNWYWYVGLDNTAEKSIAAPTDHNIPFNNMQVCLYVEPHPTTGTCGIVQIDNLPLELIPIS